MAVCLKPRLIRSGIERIKNSDDPNEIVSETDTLGNFSLEIPYSIDGKQFVQVIQQVKRWFNHSVAVCLFQFHLH